MMLVHTRLVPVVLQESLSRLIGVSLCSHGSVAQRELTESSSVYVDLACHAVHAGSRRRHSAQEYATLGVCEHWATSHNMAQGNRATQLPVGARPNVYEFVSEKGNASGGPRVVSILPRMDIIAKRHADDVRERRYRKSIVVYVGVPWIYPRNVRGERLFVAPFRCPTVRLHRCAGCSKSFAHRIARCGKWRSPRSRPVS